jgi:hypothetical protein
MSNKKSMYECDYKYEENNIKKNKDVEINKHMTNYGNIK